MVIVGLLLPPLLLLLLFWPTPTPPLPVPIFAVIVGDVEVGVRAGGVVTAIYDDVGGREV